MSDRLRIGVIGCGSIARVSHVPHLSAIKGVEIAVLCDNDAAKAEAIREELAPRAKVVTELDACLAETLDAVTICTPNHLHFPQTMAALEAGFHVLCEKPIAGTVADADKMVAAAKRQGVLLHVNQSLRYSPTYVTLARLLHDGAIGDPMHARFLRAGGNRPDQGWAPGSSWFVSRAHQGGLLLDIGVHSADVLTWLMGDVTAVTGFVRTLSDDIDVPDNIAALYRFANGATAVMELSWTFPLGGTLLEIYGTAGRLRHGVGDQPITLEQWADGETTTSHPEPHSPMNSFENFVAAVRGEMPSKTPGELGRHAVMLCEAVTMASESGRTIVPW